MTQTGKSPATTGETLFDKVWNQHVVSDLGDERYLLHVDRHLLHDLGGPRGLAAVAERGCGVRHPELTFATADHAISSAPGRTAESTELGARLVRGLRKHTGTAGIRFFDLGQPGQGIVHVIGPELGLTLPGLLLVCGDSHTSTHGALGAMAWGIGSSELAHVLATQTLYQYKPKRMRVRFEGSLGPGVGAKDLILHLIGRLGAAGADGYAVEYAGGCVRGFSVEARMTLCNLSIEMGAKIGMVAPDDVTYEYLAGRPWAPAEELWEQALAHWRTLPSDDDASFDREEQVDVTQVGPQITWGTSPQDVVAVDEPVPDPEREADAARREAMRQALAYMALEAGQAIAGVAIDRVFIGSCANSRLEDLRRAAAVVRGRKVAQRVVAWVVPGSVAVKRQAQAEGLDRVFRDAGFEWREPGCSMCVGVNGEHVPPGQRSLSTSNRNFVGRQGPGARTHLASPVMTAAAAVTGVITDVRRFGLA